MSTVVETIQSQKRPGWLKWVVLTLILAVITFLSNPFGPLGSFWRPAAGMPTPNGQQVILFIILGAFEALSFGLGISFLVFGYPIIHRVLPHSRGLTIAAFLSIAWLLIEWWPHNSLHFHNGTDLAGLLVIDYAFHVTSMIAGAIMAYFFFRLAAQGKETLSQARN